MKNKKITDLIIFISLCTIAGIISVYQGSDKSWDFFNYHYYGPWALFHGRIGYDIMPCGIQSYFNPLLDFPLYFYIRYFNDYPDLISFMQGIWWGVCGFFVYKIASIVFCGNGKTRLFYILTSVLIGITGSVSVLETGLSWNDLIISSFVLLSFYIYLKDYFLPEGKQSFKILLCSSFILGAAAGAKFTGFIFFVGFIVAHAMYSIIKKENIIKNIFFPFIAFLIGFLITGLWWYALIWYKFGNPFFPIANNIFKSDLAFPSNHADIRHLPDNITEYLFFPFYWTTHPGKSKVIEHYMVDFRYCILYVTTLLLIFKIAIDKIKNKISDSEYVRIKPVIFLTVTLNEREPLLFFVHMHTFMY